MEFHKLAKRMGPTNLESRVTATGFLQGQPWVNISLDVRPDDLSAPIQIAQDFTRALEIGGIITSPFWSNTRSCIYVHDGKTRNRLFVIDDEAPNVRIAPLYEQVYPFGVRTIMRAYVETLSRARAQGNQ